MVAGTQKAMLITSSAEDVAMVRKTMATMTMIEDPGDPDVMLPDLGMSSSSGSSTAESKSVDIDECMDSREEDISTTQELPTRETFDNARMARTKHTRNTIQLRDEEREPSGHARESSAHTRDSTTQFTAHTRETAQTAPTRATTQTFQTYHTQGEESQFTYETFQTFATTGCETIGDASVEMKNALIYIQESVGNCLGVDIADEVKASMGEVEQKTAEIVEDRKEIWNVLLDQVEDQMIEQLGDHWLEQGDDVSKRRGRATRSSSSRRSKQKGSGGQRKSSSRSREQRRSKERKSDSRERRSGSSRDRGTHNRAGGRRTRSAPSPKQSPRDETREDILVDDDAVERTMLTEIQRAGSEDSPVGERSVLYFAA